MIVKATPFLFCCTYFFKFYVFEAFSFNQRFSNQGLVPIKIPNLKGLGPHSQLSERKQQSLPQSVPHAL